MFAPPAFSLLVFCDEKACQSAGRTVVETVTLALDAKGIERVAFLIREKDSALSFTARKRRAEQKLTQLAPVVFERGAHLLVHTFAHLAQSFEGCGLHLSSQVGVHEVERLRRTMPDTVIGQSLHKGDAFHPALNYATLSPLFAPLSKPGDSRETLGIETFLHESRAFKDAAFALGGIEKARVPLLRKMGIERFALLSAVMKARSPASAIEALLDLSA